MCSLTTRSGEASCSLPSLPPASSEGNVCDSAAAVRLLPFVNMPHAPTAVPGGPQ